MDNSRLDSGAIPNPNTEDEGRIRQLIGIIEGAELSEEIRADRQQTLARVAHIVALAGLSEGDLKQVNDTEKQNWSFAVYSVLIRIANGVKIITAQPKPLQE